jgi:catechol-2,3-dioxygenase
MPYARPTKVAHVVYRTRRFGEMLEWYQTVFEARVQFQNPALAFLTFDDEHHRLALANMEVLNPGGDAAGRQGETGVDHVGYTYASLGELLENWAALKEKGITPYWSVHHGMTVSLYYADPDGNQMEFQVDCLESGERASEYMAETFSRNPIGVEFEPAAWLTRLKSGTPEAELLARQAHEPVSPLRGAIAGYVQAN